MINLFVDVGNLYYSTHKALDGKIDYVKLRNFVGEFGKIDEATCYLGFKNDGFDKMLRKHDYNVKHIVGVGDKMFPSSVDISIDVVENINKLTVVVSNNSSLFALYRRLHENGNKFLVLGVDNAGECEEFISTNRLELPRSVLI